MAGKIADFMGRGLGMVLAALLLVACSGESASPGELGRSRFAWNEGLFGCLPGCDAGESMASGAIALLDVVNADQLPPFEAASDAPDIIEFSAAGSTSVRCEAHRAGTAGLILLDPSVQQIDRIDIDAREVDRIEISDEELFRDRYTLALHGTGTLGFTLFRGRRALLGVGAVDYAFSGGIGPSEATLTDAFGRALADIFAGANREYVEIEAMALGDGVLEVTASSGAMLAVPVSIVDETAVTRVSLEPLEGLSVGETCQVRAAALLGDEPVHGAECAWQLDPAEGVITVEREGADFIELTATAPGTVTLTCSVGGAVGSLDVQVL